jgi:hypothetical protein
MRHKILAAVAAAFIATVGISAPAQAISASSSDVYVVHGIPGVAVDVYVNGTKTLSSGDATPFVFGSVAGPLDLAAGNYAIKVFAQGDDPATATPLINVAAAAVPANKSVSLVAQYDATGTPMLGVYVNNIDKTAPGQGRITVRHAANAGAVNVIAGGASVADNVTNGMEFVTDLGVGNLTAGVAAAGATTPIIIPTNGTAATVSIKEGVNLIVYAVGDGAANPSSLQLITQSISGLHSNPAGVNTGTGGQASETSPLLIGGGIAGIVALLAFVVAGAYGVRAARTRRS